MVPVGHSHRVLRQRRSLPTGHGDLRSGSQDRDGLARLELGLALLAAYQPLGTDRPARLRELRGKVVVVYFWAVWCVPCKPETKRLTELYEKYHKAGLEIIAVSLDEKETLVLTSADDFKLKAVNDVFQSKLVKRGVPLKALSYGAIEPAAGSTVRQRFTLQQGIPIERAREIVKLIKNSKKKVQAAIQGDLVRVSGKDRDTLQEIMALLRQNDFGIDMQFTNYRSN